MDESMEKFERKQAMRQGFETAFINGSLASELAFRPQFISNNPKEGKKVLSSIEEELLRCDYFEISVAFITESGIVSLLMTLKELEKRGICGKILTTDYLNFSEPKALLKLHSLSNITLKMYDADEACGGFHTKGYIFRKQEVYRIIIGSSNMTKTALTTNREWNTKIVSDEQGELAQEIVKEFDELWNSDYSHTFDEFYEAYRTRYEIVKKQRAIAKLDPEISLEKYKLKPNTMQVGFITNLRKIVEAGENKALLISATGTGKTYASAFAMRELGFKRVLFLVHRGQLAEQTKKAYGKVFDHSVSMGLVGAGHHEYDADFVFATVQTLNKDEHLLSYSPDAFQCIVIDEAHHVPAATFQKVLKHFTPKLWLGMTATPDKRDDNIEGRNVYEIFDHRIAYEIRLQQAMEENLLCPFHYFGITDVSIIGDRTKEEKDFTMLTSDERVKHIIREANYYGYSGSRLKGLIFCSRKKEAEALSEIFNHTVNPETGNCFRTAFLSGETPDEKRAEAFQRLAMEESEATAEKEPLDYIFSVEILNEGVDIVEVNQVIMLRPTESPIVFIQQLGRGLRKADGKEYVVILDFIGNYKNNFMIPIALSGDRTYNADTIRKYVISGNRVIPGASTVHFDEIARTRIFESIDKLKGMKAIIRESYVSLKNRLGRIPRLLDFYENGEVDPLVIIREYKTYDAFASAVEKDYKSTLTAQEKLTTEYLSKTILSGVRPDELEILKMLTERKEFCIEEFQNRFRETYGREISEQQAGYAIDVLSGKFVSKREEYERYRTIELFTCDRASRICRMVSYEQRLGHAEFKAQIEDLIQVGLSRYRDIYGKENADENGFVRYEKYSRRDVSLLMNAGKDLSSTMYGKWRSGEDVFLFITYHKTEAGDGQLYAEGKPDYADAFVNPMIFNWDSQIGKGPNSSYMDDVRTPKRKHLLVKKSDAEAGFYYMGTFDIAEERGTTKPDNNGKKKPITKVVMKMHHPVREDLLCYLESSTGKEEKTV